MGPDVTPADSDEFNSPTLGLQWQWQANPQPNWAFPAPAVSALRLISIPSGAPDATNKVNLWTLPNVLLQKFPGPEFTVTSKLRFTPRFPGDQTGLVIFGESYSSIVVENIGSTLVVRQVTRQHASDGGDATASPAISLTGDTTYLRACVEKGAQVTFSYSSNGIDSRPLGDSFQATAGRWIGAKVGLFAIGSSTHEEYGYADYDWFRFSR